MTKKDEVSIVDLLKEIKIKKSTAKRLGKLARGYIWFQVVVAIIVIIMVLLAMTKSLRAEDFGVVGQTYEIAEKDAIEEIKEKLEIMAKSGELKEHEELIKERVSESVRKPKSLNLKRTEQERVFYYNPEITVKKDIRDARGVVFQRAGSKVNPLNLVSLPYDVIFFDGEDEKQLEYGLLEYKIGEIKPKLILTGGSPIEVEEKHGIDVYFDQGGVLTKQLGISQVPAVMSQEGQRLKIREVYIK